jgi:hypothetical protein
MNDQLMTLSLPSWLSTHSATSSLASASGASPCAVPGGPTTDPAGLGHAHASLSPRLAKVLGLMTSGTYGPRSTGSSASAALQSSLENKLRQRTASAGSTLYRLTWKDRGTPQGHSISALRASAHRTSDSGSTGWQTPKATETMGRYGITNGKKYLKLWGEAEMAGWPTPIVNDQLGSTHCYSGKNADGSNRIALKLPGAVKLTGWPTPRANDNVQTNLDEIAATGSSWIGQGRGATVATMAQMAGWTTTTTRDWKDTGGDIKPRADGSERFDQLPRQANLAGWRTPTCQSPNSLRGNGQDPEKRLAQGHAVNLTDEVNWLKDNPQPARLTVTGEMLTGSTAGMESGGQLNPAHSRWLMGLPAEWDACAPTVTPSSRRSRKPSSAPT